MFQGVEQQTIGEIPPNTIKAFANLEDIYEMNYLPQEREEKKTICIHIPEERINQPSPNDLANPASSRTMPIVTSREVDYTERKMKFVKWIFHFQFDLKQKLARLR